MIHEHEWDAYLDRIKEAAIESAFIAEELKNNENPEHLIHAARANELFGLLEELQDTLWEVQWFTDVDEPPR